MDLPFEEYPASEMVKFLDSEVRELDKTHSSYGCIGCEICTRAAMFGIIANDLELADYAIRVFGTRLAIDPTD